jgi:chemotaxis protein MotB
MGSLAKAFGVQRKTKAFQTPKGVKMIARDFDQPLIPTREREEFAQSQKRQEVGQKLKKEIETRFQDRKDMVQVEVGAGEVTIRLMGETAFDSGRADIKLQLRPLLLKIGSVLQETKGDVIIAAPMHRQPWTKGKKRPYPFCNDHSGCSAGCGSSHRRSPGFWPGWP